MFRDELRRRTQRARRRTQRAIGPAAMTPTQDLEERIGLAGTAARQGLACYHRSLGLGAGQPSDRTEIGSSDTAQIVKLRHFDRGSIAEG